MFDASHWAAVPFHFWSGVFFVFGAIAGSFLNVCIHRLPRGESVIGPRSHCPHCQRPIPWRLNIPLISWLWLRGRCAFCGARVSARYFLVELLTGTAFVACWLRGGPQSAGLALVYCLVAGGLIAATFIDLEHFIIPDEITLGGIGAGFLCSLAVPQLHGVEGSLAALQRCLLGAALGGGVIYVLLRLGKFLFGRQRFKLAPGSRVWFTETSLVLPDQEIPYEEIFYRRSDTIVLHARLVELVDRGYWNVPVRMTQTELAIGADRFPTEAVPCLEAVTDRVTVPREAMGLGDVKFMAAIGAFVGWVGVVFALMASAFVGSAVGMTLIVLRGRAASTRIPYGPYLAVAALGWVFLGERLLRWWLPLR